MAQIRDDVTDFSNPSCINYYRRNRISLRGHPSNVNRPPFTGIIDGDGNNTGSTEQQMWAEIQKRTRGAPCGPISRSFRRLSAITFPGRVGEICGRGMKGKRGLHSPTLVPFFEVKASSCSAWLPLSKPLMADRRCPYVVLERHTVRLAAWCSNRRPRRTDSVTVNVSVIVNTGYIPYFTSRLKLKTH